MKTKEIVNKKLDCVPYTRKERERIAQKTEGKSPKDIVAYFRKRRNKTTISKVQKVI